MIFVIILNKISSLIKTPYLIARGVQPTIFVSQGMKLPNVLKSGPTNDETHEKVRNNNYVIGFLIKTNAKLYAFITNLIILQSQYLMRLI